MNYVENGVSEDFAKLCFEGMTVPLCELSEEEYIRLMKKKEIRTACCIQQRLSATAVMTLFRQKWRDSINQYINLFTSLKSAVLLWQN